MKVLFPGGTGIISTACTQQAVARGFHVTLLNRARRPVLPGTHQITADITDPAATAAALGEQNWDAVVDFIAFTPAEIEQRIALFRGRTGQYVFISSASAYQKPLAHYLITESTPLANPFWDYSRNKAAGEERLQQAWREEAFPATTIRPSLTYGDTVVPLAVNNWLKSYTAVDRMRRGLPVIVPGDGLSLWTITHNSDFAKGLVGLLGQQGGNRSGFSNYLQRGPDVESDLSIHGGGGGRSGTPAGAYRLRFHHGLLSGRHGDVAGRQVALRRVRQHQDQTLRARFHHHHAIPRGHIVCTIAWFYADPARQQIDEEANAAWDRLIAAMNAVLRPPGASLGAEN